MIRLPSNFYVWLGPSTIDHSDRPRLMTPLVGCDQCQYPIRDGNAALVLLSADLELPGPHPSLPVVVHRECLDAFHERKPTRWLVWGTVREFLRQVTLATNVDDIQKEREERKQPKKKAKDGFAA